MDTRYLLYFIVKLETGDSQDLEYGVYRIRVARRGEGEEGGGKREEEEREGEKGEVEGKGWRRGREEGREQVLFRRLDLFVGVRKSKCYFWKYCKYFSFSFFGF